MNKKHKPTPFLFCISPILVFFLINYLVSLAFIIYAIISQKVELGTQEAFNTLLDFTNIHMFEMEICAYIITFCFMYFFKFRKFEKKCFDNRYINLLEFKDILLAISCGIGVYLITDIAIVILDGLFDLNNIIAAHNESVSAILTDNILKDIILLGIAAPIAEEYMFRGLVFNRIRLFIEEKSAIFLSAIIFAFMHVGTILQIGYAFALGYVLSYSYAKFENIKIPVIIHMSFNLTNCLFYIPFLNELLNTKIGYLVYYISGVVLIVFAVKKLRDKEKPINRLDLVMSEKDMMEPW